MSVLYVVVDGLVSHEKFGRERARGNSKGWSILRLTSRDKHAF